jgi:hypothetical protein
MKSPDCTAGTGLAAAGDIQLSLGWKMATKSDYEICIRHLKEALTTTLDPEKRAWCEQQILEHQRALQEIERPSPALIEPSV